MRSAKKLTIILMAMAVLMTMAACQDTRTFEAPTIENQPTDNTPEQQVDTSDSNAKEVLRDLLETEPVFKATYSVRNAFQGEEQSGTETVVIKGDDSKRVFQGETFYVLGEEVYLCIEDAGTSCYSIPQEEPPQPVDVSIPEGVDVEEVNGRQISGEQARCFRISDENSTAIDCRSEDGVLLYFKRTEGEYEVELTAQTLTRNVPDSEFELPAEPQEFNPEDFMVEE